MYSLVIPDSPLRPADDRIRVDIHHTAEEEIPGSIGEEIDEVSWIVAKCLQVRLPIGPVKAMSMSA